MNKVMLLFVGLLTLSSLSAQASQVSCEATAGFAAIAAHNEKYPGAVGANVVASTLSNQTKTYFTKLFNKATRVYIVTVAEESQEATWLVVTRAVAPGACVPEAVVRLAAEH